MVLIVFNCTDDLLNTIGLTNVSGAPAACGEAPVVKQFLTFKTEIVSSCNPKLKYIYHTSVMKNSQGTNNLEACRGQLIA